MSTLPPCPKCNSEYTYEDGTQLVCPECAHEWSPGAAAEAGDSERVIKDSVGNVLQDGETHLHALRGQRFEAGQVDLQRVARSEQGAAAKAEGQQQGKG